MLREKADSDAHTQSVHWSDNDNSYLQFEMQIHVKST